jgi:hypothetical protein
VCRPAAQRWLGVRLQACENGVLREISGPKKEEVTGVAEKVHTGQRHGAYCMEDGMGRACGTYGEKKFVQGLVRKPEGDHL